MSQQPVLMQVAMLADGVGRRIRPASILLEAGRVVVADEPARVGTPASAMTVEHHDVVALPALVNAHCHLDLSHLDPAPFDGDFVAWIEMIIEARAVDDEAIAASVARGIALSRAGGVALVGDIAGAGSRVPARVLQESALAAVSFIEVFGLGSRQAAAIARMREVAALGNGAVGRVRLGVQPHAPYTCGPDVYGAACDLGVPVASHLAETPEEIAFARHGDGPLADLLRRRGVGDEDLAPLGAHPIDALAPALQRGRHVVAHLNYIEPAHLKLLGQWDVHVAYCPRASAYFGHPRDGAAPHAYRAMLERGINVALGTDGRPCLDTPDRISTLDEIRFLYDRDGADPLTLLRMATINGASALGADPADFSFAAGASAGIIGVPVEPDTVDPLRDALRSSAAPRWLFDPARAGEGAA